MDFLIHKSEDRGSYKGEWLDTKYSFSFSNYYNPNRLGFGSLVVLNDDIIFPNNGFGFHPHSNMEIITLVLKGELSHRDSMKNYGKISAGDVQVMSAGKGIIHSEYNDSSNEKVELFQIWINPSKMNLNPTYSQKKPNWMEKEPKVIVSGKKRKESLYINQDAEIIAGKIKKNEIYKLKLKENRGLFLMNVNGKINVNGNILDKRDSMEIKNVKELKINSLEDSIILAIDVKI